MPSAFFTVYNPDVFILGWALTEGKAKYINETMSMYRVHNEGIYSSLSKDEKRILRYATRLKFFEFMGSRYRTEYDLTLKSLTQTLTKIRERGKRELYRKYRKHLPLRVRISLSLKRFYSRLRS